MKIMLVCAAGMSTSLLVTKWKKLLQQWVMKLKSSLYQFLKEKRVGDVDCILLGPQVRFQNIIEKLWKLLVRNHVT
ncbi:MAG: PTS sugar transporter subunit IIB [Faecalibacillus faecis]